MTSIVLLTRCSLSWMEHCVVHVDRSNPRNWFTMAKIGMFLHMFDSSLNRCFLNHSIILVKIIFVAHLVIFNIHLLIIKVFFKFDESLFLLYFEDSCIYDSLHIPSCFSTLDNFRRLFLFLLFYFIIHILLFLHNIFDCLTILNVDSMV